MTVERKIIIGLEDIKAVLFKCTACDSRMSVVTKADEPIRIPHECHNCHRTWSLLEPAQYEHVGSPFVNFTSSLTKIISHWNDGVKTGFRILLELEEPKRES